MTPKELKNILKQAEVPCAYYRFEENTKQGPPFICYFFDGGEDRRAVEDGICHMVCFLSVPMVFLA